MSSVDEGSKNSAGSPPVKRAKFGSRSSSCRSRTSIARRTSTPGWAGGWTPTSRPATTSASSSSRRRARNARSSSARHHFGGARLGPGPAPGRRRHRGGARGADRARCAGQRGLPRRQPGGRFTRVRPRRPGPRPNPLRLVCVASATLTATAGCCRRSRRGFPAAERREQWLRAMSPSRTWRRRCGARRRRTASTRSESAKPTRTGRTGTRTTWCASAPARSCRHDATTT